MRSRLSGWRLGQYVHERGDLWWANFRWQVCSLLSWSVHPKELQGDGYNVLTSSQFESGLLRQRGQRMGEARSGGWVQTPDGESSWSLESRPVQKVTQGLLCVQHSPLNREVPPDQKRMVPLFRTSLSSAMSKILAAHWAGNQYFTQSSNWSGRY